MNIVVIALQVLLGLAFMGSGGSKIAGAPMQVQSFDHYRLPQWVRPIVGTVEIIGALGLLVGVAVPWFATIAAIWLSVVMLGALLTHIWIHDAARSFVPPAVLLAAAALVVALRSSPLVGHFS